MQYVVAVVAALSGRWAWRELEESVWGMNFGRRAWRVSFAVEFEEWAWGSAWGVLLGPGCPWLGKMLLAVFGKKNSLRLQSGGCLVQTPGMQSERAFGKCFWLRSGGVWREKWLVVAVWRLYGSHGCEAESRGSGCKPCSLKILYTIDQWKAWKGLESLGLQSGSHDVKAALAGNPAP